MSEENKVTRVSDILRITAQNTSNLLIQVANRIDELESHIEKLERHILIIEGSSDASRPTE